MWLFIDIFILTVHCVLINSIKMLCFLILSSFLLYGTKCQDDSEGLYTSKVLRNNNSLLLEYEDSRYFFNTEFEVRIFFLLLSDNTNLINNLIFFICYFRPISSAHFSFAKNETWSYWVLKVPMKIIELDCFL